MTVTMNATQFLSFDTVLLSWSSDEATPTYYIYRDGELIDTTAAESLTVTIETEVSPVYEVLDDPLAAPLAGYPARQELCWYAATDAESYRVDEYIGSAWVQRDSLTDDGSPFFSWTTRPLEDSQTHQFRVVPIGAAGNEGTAQTYSIFMIRYPDPPEVTMTYSAVTGAVTIGAA